MRVQCETLTAPRRKGRSARWSLLPDHIHRHGIAASATGSLSTASAVWAAHPGSHDPTDVASGDRQL
jgi:hypothetical protein